MLSPHQWDIFAPKARKLWLLSIWCHVQTRFHPDFSTLPFLPLPLSPPPQTHKQLRSKIFFSFLVLSSPWRLVCQQLLSTGIMLADRLKEDITLKVCLSKDQGQGGVIHETSSKKDGTDQSTADHEGMCYQLETDISEETRYNMTSWNLKVTACQCSEHMAATWINLEDNVLSEIS